MGRHQLTFERTKDYALVRSIVTDRFVYRAELLADSYPSRQEYRVLEGNNVWHVLAKRGKALLGVCTFVESLPAWESHIAMLPGAWGPGSAAVGRAAMRWLAANSKCKRLFCLIPEFNRPALAFIRRVGWEEVGVDRNWITRHGKAFLKIRFETAVTI